MSMMSRRHLMLAATGAAALAAAPRFAFAQAAAPAAATPFVLPPLTYPVAALEPHIDAKTMEIHHDKHHMAFITNLNTFAKDNPTIASMSPVDVLGKLGDVPEAIRTGVRNNMGGHANHTMFWQIMGGAGGAPSGAIAAAINDAFGEFGKLQETFNARGTAVFGSGWAFVVSDKAGKLSLVTTPNQDSPIMNGQMPIFGNDVWEHAYYLKYQNRRADYMKSWWNVVNWDAVNQRYADAKAGKFTV